MLTGHCTGLRAIEPDDLETLRTWRNRPENRRYFREYREISSLEQQEWHKLQRSNPHCRMFSIVELEHEIPVGAAGLCGIDWLRRSAEVSIYIGDGYIDGILAPDALHVLLEYGFDELGLHRAYAEVYQFDAPKQDLLQGEGFRLEGQQRQAHWAEGHWHNVYIYGMLSSEFDEEKNELRW